MFNCIYYEPFHILWLWVSSSLLFGALARVQIWASARVFFHGLCLFLSKHLWVFKFQEPIFFRAVYVACHLNQMKVETNALLVTLAPGYSRILTCVMVEFFLLMLLLFYARANGFKLIHSFGMFGRSFNPPLSLSESSHIVNLNRNF